MLRRAAPVAMVFGICAAVYVATLGGRIAGPSPNNHYVHLADSYLHGQLHLVADKPPGRNDWARYGGRWYVSFPPLPALVILPAVAIWGTAVWDPLFWALFAGLGPAMLFLWLRALRESGHSPRTQEDDLWLTALFAFGTAFYYSSVQGTVWFAAHVVAVPLTALFAHFATGARRPLLAGLCLGACFMARPSTLWLALFFGFEAVTAAPRRRPEGAGTWLSGLLARLSAPGREPGAGARVLAWLRASEPHQWVPRCLLFSLPVLAVLGLSLWLNQARFDDPLVFGHEHLQIRWRARIERWGLFDYHYLARNLGVWLAALPWLSSEAPYLMISRHGLALWVTTPNLLWLPWPRRWTPTMSALAVAAAAVALMDLCYQNSGWVQFAYRFGLDYMVPCIGLLAMGGRRFGGMFKLLVVLAVVVNLFGAITFDRVHRFYDNDRTQRRVFQPD